MIQKRWNAEHSLRVMHELHTPFPNGLMSPIFEHYLNSVPNHNDFSVVSFRLI